MKSLKLLINVSKILYLYNKISFEKDLDVVLFKAQQMDKAQEKINELVSNTDKFKPIQANFIALEPLGKYVQLFMRQDFQNAVLLILESFKKTQDPHQIKMLSTPGIDAISMVKATVSPEEYQKNWKEVEKVFYRNIYFAPKVEDSNKSQAIKEKEYDGGKVALAFIHYLDGDKLAAKTIMANQCQKQGFEKTFSTERGERNNFWFYKNIPNVYQEFVAEMQKSLKSEFSLPKIK